MLDWELSTLGDPVADFAYHLMQWDMPPAEAGTGSLVGQNLAALGIPSRAAYVEAYVRRTGLDPRPHLPMYSAYNFFRSPRSCKASSAACATAPPPAHTRRHGPHWCGRWPPRRGNSPVRPDLALSAFLKKTFEQGRQLSLRQAAIDLGR